MKSMSFGVEATSTSSRGRLRAATGGRRGAAPWKPCSSSALQAVVLLGREVAVARRVDEGAGGRAELSSSALFQRDGRVVDVDGGGGGLGGGEAVGG